LSEREGTVHQCGHQAPVSLAELADLLNHDLLLKASDLLSWAE
jgi:hypothetical protein